MRKVTFTQVTATTVVTREPLSYSSGSIPTSWEENHIVVLVALDSEGQIWEKVGLEDWGRVTSPEKPKRRL